MLLKRLNPTDVFLSIVLLAIAAIGFAWAQTSVVVIPLGSESGAPAGMVVAFNRAACPEGWRENVDARGRTIVGMKSGGTPGETAGTPYANLEQRSHDHVWIRYDGRADEKNWVSGTMSNPQPLVDWDNGMDTAGADFYPIGVDSSVTGIVDYHTDESLDNIPFVQLLICEKS